MATKIDLERIHASEIFESVLEELRMAGFMGECSPFEEKFVRRHAYKQRTGTFKRGEDSYFVNDQEHCVHDFGLGGFRQREATLFKIEGDDKKRVLTARDYSSWSTLGDDSEDYPNRSKAVLIFEPDSATEGIEKFLS